MGYSWTDYPIDVGTDLIDDVHFQEAETNLNIELDRRGLPPVDLGTLDVVDDMDMTTLRQGIEDAETPTGCSDHYAAFEDAEQSNVQSTYDVINKDAIRNTNETDELYSVESIHDSPANIPNYDPFRTTGHTTECPTHNLPVYNDYQADEYGANYYWDCGAKKITIDSSNDVNVDGLRDATVLDGYNEVHMQSWLTSVNLTVDDAEDFTHCSSHNDINFSSVDSAVDSNICPEAYDPHRAIDFYAFCDSNQLNQDSGDNPTVLDSNCPFHYVGNYSGQCSTVNEPYCDGKGVDCTEFCDAEHVWNDVNKAYGLVTPDNGYYCATHDATIRNGYCDSHRISQDSGHWYEVYDNNEIVV